MKHNSLVASARSPFAAVEIAKQLEHREKRPDRALGVVDLLLSWDLPLNARTRAELRKRRERLERKLLKRGRQNQAT
jgi:hypothetical protein